MDMWARGEGARACKRVFMTSSGLVSVADVQPASSAAPVCTAQSSRGARSGGAAAASAAPSRPRQRST